MEYKQEIINKISDSDNWPKFDRPDFMDDLNELADDAIAKKTIEGYLAALLIYQQLAEEIMKLFLKDHEFFIQLAVFPAEIQFKSKSKSMFGRIIEEIKNTVTIDDSKQEIINLANDLNQIRIEIVHGLTKIPDLNNIEAKVINAKKIFDELFEKFDQAHDDFRVTFSGFKKHTDWDEMLEE
jgi:RNase P/RNase MRP subunit p29